MPDPLEWQWERAPRLYEALGWTLLGHEELEADDLLHSLRRGRDRRPAGRR